MLDKIKAALKTYMQMKKDFCANNNGPYDLAPLLNIEFENVPGFVVTNLPPGHPVDQLINVFPVMIEFGHQNNHGNINSMILLTEGYSIAGKNKDGIESYARGDLEKDFKSNPDSNVIEVLNVQAIDMLTGEQSAGFVSYKYDDKGAPEFNNPDFIICEGDNLQGNIAMLFNKCYEFVNSHCRIEK